MRSWFPFRATAALAAIVIALAAPIAAQVYVANNGGGQVVKFTGPGTGSVFASGLTYPQGITVDSAGNVYVTSGNTIMKYAPNGVGAVFTGSGLTNPFSLAFDLTGTYLYASNYNAGTISKIDSGGNVVGTLVTGKSYVNGVAFDPAGNLYATATNASAVSPAVIKFDGTTPTTFTTSNLSDPKGLAFDQAGNLYVANNGGSTIYSFTSSGGAGTLFANSSDGLSNPYGLAFTDAGLLLVANYSSGTILAFDSGGNGTVFGTGLTNPTGLAVGAIPEPSTWAAVAGVAAFALASWRRRAPRVARLNRE